MVQSPALTPPNLDHDGAEPKKSAHQVHEPGRERRGANASSTARGQRLPVRSVVPHSPGRGPDGKGRVGPIPEGGKGVTYGTCGADGRHVTLRRRGGRHGEEVGGEGEPAERRRNQARRVAR